MYLYTADLHFGHYNIIRLDGRPFADADEMDEFLIKKWNEKVKENDVVYVLGDFCFRSAKDPVEYLKRLKGRKRFVVGNHDGVLLKNRKAMTYFESVDDILTETDGKRQVVMCHYPLAEWPGYFRGTLHVYGHIHNNVRNDAWKYLRTQENALNAGCMINGWAPATLQELIENNRKFKENAQNADFTT